MKETALLNRARLMLTPRLTSSERTRLERAAKNDPQLRAALPPAAPSIPEPRGEGLRQFTVLR